MSEAATAEIAELLDNRGVSRRSLVQRVERWDPKFSGTQFWRIEHGGSPWTLDRFVFVAEALGLDPPMLLDRILRGHSVLEVLRERDGPDEKAEQTDEA